MCGITGFYQFKSKRGRAALGAIGEEMNATVIHRGPDAGGVWQDPVVPLLFGHRRLAIIDLSKAGAQPMVSLSERYVITYNGEIYNFLELRKELEAAGVHFRGYSDTEVILAGIDYWGLNLCLQKINGMFALALWDRREKTLHFVRDRLGKKPLYIGWAGEALVFGSELKVLRAHPDFKAALRRDVLALYMRYGYVPSPHCIYEGVWSLPAGFRLSLELDRIAPGENLRSRMEPYWHHLRVMEESRGRLMHQKSDSEITDEFEKLLSSCVAERMVSDVPLGAFLSGGIDSSAIVALMQKQASQPVKTYSIGFEEAGFNEAQHAKKIATHLGTDHHEMMLGSEEARSLVPYLSGMFDEPFADVSAIPTFLVSQFARRDVTVALSGDGGDEMLGGYNRHIMGPQIWKRMELLPYPLRIIMQKSITSLPTSTWDKILPFTPQAGERMYKAASVMGLKTQEDIYRRLISTWDDPGALVIGAKEPEAFLSAPEWQPRNLSFAERMMYGDALSYLPGDILTKVDRASMAVGLEARAPLLDRKIYEYVWRLPERLKIRGHKGKWLLREVLARHVPRDMFERPKQGFTMPAGTWMRGGLREWTEEMLSEKRLRDAGYLNPTLVRCIWKEHLEGKGRHTEKLWSVLMFQSWHERWMK